MKPRHATAALLAAFCLAALPARAGTTPEAAQALETQLHDWLAGLVAPALDVGPRPVEVTANGEGFRLDVRAPDSLVRDKVLDETAMARLDAKQEADGRWALENLVVPSPLRVRTAAGAGEKPRTLFEMAFEGLTFHGVLDPLFALPSHFESEWTGLRTTTEAGTTKVVNAATQSIWQPAGDGRIDMLTAATAAGIEWAMRDEDGHKAAYTAGQSRSTSRLRTLSPARLADLVRAISTFAPTVAPQQVGLTEPQRVLARRMVEDMADLAGGLSGEYTMDDIRWEAGPGTARLHSLSGAMDIAAPEGKLALAMKFAADGPESSLIPPGVWREYTPRRVVLRPRVTGLPRDELVKLLLRTIDTDPGDLDEIEAGFSNLAFAGGLVVAIDELVLDLGKAGFAGHGTATIAGPGKMEIDALLTATGLDGLIRRMNTDPVLRQAGAVMIFLKGLGAQQGDTTVWKIAYAGNRLTVNGTDISGMVPGGKP